MDIKGTNFELVEDALITELVMFLQKDLITPIYLPFVIDVPNNLLMELSNLKKCKYEADVKIEKWKEDELHKDHVKMLKYLNSRYEQIETTLTVIDEKNRYQQIG